MEWLKVFVLVLGAMFGLQFLVEIQDSFAELLGYDAGLGRILFYYAVKTPSFLTISLPAAILVSILYALGLLHRNNEFIAFRATGMSVFRITRSIWLAGLVLSIALWLLNASLIPWSVEQSRLVRDNIEFRHEARSVDRSEVGVIYPLAFDNRKDNRMWFINRYSQYLQEGYGIMVSMMDDQRREKRRVTAKSGYFDEEEKGWRMLDGRDSRFDVESGELVFTRRFDAMDLENVDDDPELMLLFRKRPKDLSYLELKRIIDNFTIEENPKVREYESRFHALIASAASCLIVTGLAIPYAVSGVRVNPAVGVSKSIALFFGYYILSSLMGALGKREILSPEVAAWSPNIFMIGLAYVLVRRVR